MKLQTGEQRTMQRTQPDTDNNDGGTPRNCGAHRLRPKSQGTSNEHQLSRTGLDHSVARINRLTDKLASHASKATKGWLFYVFQITREVCRVQAKAGKKNKTKAIRALASHPDVRLSQATLYRYRQLVHDLPKATGIDPAKFLSVRKKADFVALVGDLNLADAMAMIGVKKAAAPLLEGPTEKGTADSAEAESSDGNPRDIQSSTTEGQATEFQAETQTDGSVGDLVHGSAPENGSKADQRQFATPATATEALVKKQDDVPHLKKSPGIASNLSHTSRQATLSSSHRAPSVHVVCDDGELPKVLDHVARFGYLFVSTTVALTGREHMLLVSATDDERPSPTDDQLGTWFEASSANEAIDQFRERVNQLWPGGQFMESLP